MGKKREKLFLAAKCQLMNVEGMIKFKKSQFYNSKYQLIQAKIINECHK